MSGTSEIEVRPATAQRWADVRLVLDGDEERACWCQPWRGLARSPGAPARSRSELLLAQIEAADGARASADAPEALLCPAGPAGRSLGRSAFEPGGPPPPGFVAYLGEVPVGWCGVAVRGSTPRLDGSRVIPSIDDRPVWAIGCFRIRVGYRRRGVARELLAAVVEAARAAGAPGVEAYPIDPEGRRVDVGFAYVGIASMFDAAGFCRVRITDARSAGLARWLVRLDFEESKAVAPLGGMRTRNA